LAANGLAQRLISTEDMTTNDGLSFENKPGRRTSPLEPVLGGVVNSKERMYQDRLCGS